MRPLALVSLSLALSLTLACRNTPPEDTATVVDLDGDGIPSDVDCNDGDAAVSPTATELCDGIDNNCDGQVDEADGAGAFTWYPDADGDGFGLGAGEVVGCTLPEGYAEQGGDCNDALATSFPGATETCNGVDDDCDGEVDNGVLSTFYADSDADGYGDADSTANACEAPSGYVADATDCDDAAAIANPGAAEICDAASGDCLPEECSVTGMQAECTSEQICLERRCIELSPRFFGNLCAGCEKVSSSRYQAVMSVGPVEFIGGKAASSNYRLESGVIHILAE